RNQRNDRTRRRWRHPIPGREADAAGQQGSMTFPPEVERYVEATIIESKRPFCLRVDRNGRVVETWGAAAEYGLDCLRPGDDACEHAPFLEACLDGTGQIPFITDSHGHSFHAHLLGDNDGLYVLLIDAQQELEERRRAQQK